MPSTDWQLFVDESGDFRDPSDTVCVAGVLVALPDIEPVRDHLQAAFTGVFPLAPYPPHATVLNRPSSRALLALAGKATGRGVQLPERSIRAIDAAIDALRGATEPTVVEAVRRATLGVTTEWEDASVCDVWLSANAPAVFGELRNVLEEENAALRQRVFAALSSVLAANEDDGPGTPWAKPIVFLAAEATPPAVPTDDETRYLDLLETLFERVYSLLRSTDEVRRHVIAHVATRPLRRGERKRMLSLVDVAEASRRASRLPFLQPATFPDPYVWLSVVEPCRFDERVHPGVVLADFAANRARSALGGAPKLEAVLQDRVRNSLGDVVLAMRPMARPNHPPLSAAAASGVSRSHVAAALGGESVKSSALASVKPGWASQQAQHWQAAARKLRGEA